MRGSASERNPWPARTQAHVAALKETLAALDVNAGQIGERGTPGGGSNLL
jgi:hypothetical protein